MEKLRDGAVSLFSVSGCFRPWWTSTTSADSGYTSLASRPQVSFHSRCAQLGAAVKRRIPALRWIPQYQSSDLFSDIVGGLTIGMVCFAQTLAHAAIATTKPAQGPYCAFVPPIAYAIFGTSPHASISSGAIAAILIADQLRPWSDIEDRTKLASLLALFSGITLVLMGMFNLAFAVRFLSQPTISGFMTAGSLIIIANQCKNLFGFSQFPHTSGFVDLVYKLASSWREVDLISLGLGLALMLVLWSFNQLKAIANRGLKKAKAENRLDTFNTNLKKVSETKEIVVSLLGILFGYITATPEGEPMLTTIGELPSGIPPFEVPWDIPEFKGLLLSGHLHSFAFGGVLVAFTTFLTTYATAKKMALQYSYALDAGQEMIGLGCAGIAGSFFCAFPPSGSLSRTGLAADCGVRTQLAGLLSAGVIALCLTFLTPWLRFLPKSTLASIIIMSTKGLIDLETPRKLWKSWKPELRGGLKRDLVIWCIAFTVTLLMGVLPGIAAAVAVSVALIVADAAAPSGVVLGCVEQMGKKWRNIEDWPGATMHPGVLVFEFRGPLTFASAELFQDQIEMKRIWWDEASKTKTRIVVLSFSSVYSIDASALGVLEELLREWSKKDIRCVISGAKAQVRMLVEEELGRRLKLLDQPNYILSVNDAVTLGRRRLDVKSKHLDKKEEEDLLKQASGAREIQRQWRRRKMESTLNLQTGSSARSVGMKSPQMMNPVKSAPVGSFRGPGRRVTSIW